MQEEKEKYRKLLVNLVELKEEKKMQCDKKMLTLKLLYFRYTKRCLSRGNWNINL
jgi:hypothetical protein